MSKADIVAAILWAGATLYAIFGGADFGAGIVTLFTPRKREIGGRLRARIGHSLGPVWEANHVWLIFCLVVLWTAFPKAFGPIMETLYVPLALAALGIVLRGSGFAFGHAFTGRAHDRAERVFAFASLMTPFFMGCVVGAIASGEVSADGSPGALDWIDWLPIVVGLMFVASSAYLASVFLVVDAAHAGEDDAREWFRQSAIAWAIAAGVLAIAGLFALDGQASYIADRMRAEGLPLMLASLLLGGLALSGLLARRRRGLRPLAVGAVVTVIWGWGVAQFPYLLPTTLTISAGAGAEPTLTAVIVVFGFALAIVGPALVFLYRLSQAQVLE